MVKVSERIILMKIFAILYCSISKVTTSPFEEIRQSLLSIANMTFVVSKLKRFDIFLSCTDNMMISSHSFH